MSASNLNPTYYHSYVGLDQRKGLGMIS